MENAIALVAILLVATPSVIRCTGVGCSPEEIEDPLKKCACVQKGYGSAEDEAQCLERKPNEHKRNGIDLRAVPSLVQQLSSGDSVNGVRRKRSWQQQNWKFYPRTYCVSLTEKGGRGSCAPGTTFMMACNICKCKPSGNSAMCTKKSCDSVLRERCEPGSVRTAHCNSCICSPNGRWACSKKECRTRLRYVSCTSDSEQTTVAPSVSACPPGTSFMRGCNRCYCSKDGKSAVCRSLPCNGITGVEVLMDGQNNTHEYIFDYGQGR